MWGMASALPPAFRAASRGEDQSARSHKIWRWFVAGDAERKLGGRAEAMPHKLACEM